jgi:hypothetical protein
MKKAARGSLLAAAFISEAFRSPIEKTCDSS